MSLSRDEIIARLAEGERDLSGLDLAGTDLSRLDLRGVNLSRADLSSADLRWAVLEGADLSSSVLRQADARWAIFRGANVRQADLRRANLAWSDLAGADLLGADLDGATLDNASLGEGALPRRGRPARPRATEPGASRAALPAGWSIREASPAVLLLFALGCLLVIQGWGWLYRRFYFDAFFTAGNITIPPNLVTFFDPANFFAGLFNVVLRTALMLVALPFLVLALALVIGAFLAIPLGLIYLGERLLGDVIRPRWRPVVVFGLFIAYFAVFITAFPVAAFANQWVRTQGLPEGPVLGDALALFQVGGWITRLGLIAVLAAFGFCLWVGFRWFSHWLSTYEFPTRWRLRYPAWNDALVRARGSRLFSRNEPLTDEERRRGLIALAITALLLATLTTGVGAVSAYHDMCDGGRLPRVQLYIGQPPAVADTAICERMLVLTDTNYYVFFPNQTTQRIENNIATRVVNLKEVPHTGVSVMTAAGGKNDCATCLNEPGRVTGTEWFIYDPNLVETQGTVQAMTTPDFFTVQPTDPTMAGSVRLSNGTVVTINGLPAGPDAIVPGRIIAARGKLDEGGQVLGAVVVNIVEGSPAPVGTPGTPAAPLMQPTIDVLLNNPAVPVINGSSWHPGNTVAIGIGRRSDPTPKIRTPLPGGVVTVDSSGSFSVPIEYQSQFPTGPDFITVAQDSVTGQVATGPWLLAPPPPTQTLPTQPPLQTAEVTAPPAVTPTANHGTNTPFPPNKPGGTVTADCTPDEFEYDNTRPFQKEIYVGVGEGAKGVQHNFCPKKDVDLMYFYVKAGRSYRVETKNLAQGVDTVMAVGDLNPSTPCMPAGCWNDDAAALTFASLIQFTAIEDDTALITVSNRGGLYGTTATYELSVTEFVPTPTPTPSLAPSPTSSATPTSTPTPLPFMDVCETSGSYTDNNTCRRACPNRPVLNGPPYQGIIYPAGDKDFFMPVTLGPGTYQVVLRPPSDENYDLIIHDVISQSSDNCPPSQQYMGLGQAGGPGQVESITLNVTTTTQFSFEVNAYYYTTYYNANEPYSLSLIQTNATNTPGTPTMTLTSTPPTPPTLTPTSTPKFGPPVLTPTPTDTPTSTFLLAPPRPW